MTPDVTQQPAGGQAPVDTDAVCQECNTVNTDGSLMCRNCGNNLRDQKLRRLQNEIPPDLNDGPSIQNIVRGVVGVVGLLSVLIVALASDDIANAFVGGSTPAAPYARHFRGPGAINFEPLEKSANAVLLSADTVASAQANPPAPGFVNGNYILTAQSDGASALQILGTASVTEEGDRLLFLANLTTGVQIRGIAYRQGGKAFLSEWDDAAVRLPSGEIVGATGAAVTQQDGSLDCYGRYDLDELSYGAIAYLLP